MIFQENIRKSAFLLLSFFISSAPATAACLRPFLEEARFADAPLSAGIALPLASGLFSYETCEGEYEALSCLFRASIDNGANPQTTLAVFSTSDDGSSASWSADTRGTVIASSPNGGQITASQIKLSDARIARIDVAMGNGRPFMLLVEHPVFGGYPEIEVLQAYLRQSIVICGEEVQ